ncbi:MAG TPA: glycosyltransferase family A protein [Candidatus Binatia bacterium]|nr:glycosyltransferase family A protein [Candidatus Binatia bacterium]
MKISVVIPYYQRNSGILRRAVSSALKQKFLPFEIVVVDDGSPVPARAELQDLLLNSVPRVVIVQQPNAGADIARNKALDNVHPEADYVAFLDSDDEWFEDHLAHASWALEQGFDVYFSDFYQLNQKISAFNRAKRIRVEEHKKIHPTEPIYEYQGDMFNQILTGNILGTSTIVYNYRKFSTVRQPEGFKHTGHEYIFWLDLATQTKQFAFSARPACRYGNGVNIFAEPAWGTDKYLSVLHDEIKYRKYILNNYNLSPEQAKFVRQRIQASRESFARGLVHNLLSNGKIDRAVLLNQWRIDPLSLVSALWMPGILLYERFRHNLLYMRSPNGF